MTRSNSLPFVDSFRLPNPNPLGIAQFQISRGDILPDHMDAAGSLVSDTGVRK